VITGQISGIVPARGTTLKSNAAAAKPAASAGNVTTTCTEPDCNLVYNGGQVQHAPRVYLVFWGPKWTSDTATQTLLTKFFTGLGQTTKGDSWSTIVSQYSDATGHPTFSGSLFASSWVDTSTPPASVTMTNLGTEALSAASHFGITDAKDADVVIASQSGTCFADASPGFTFAGNCGTPQSAGGYCAFHTDVVDSSSYLPFTNLPYQLDAQAGCGENFVNLGSAGVDDGWSIVAGHEATETITDPTATGWVDNNDSVSGGEIADKCAWGGQLWGDNDPYGNVTLATGKFAMQSLWSNAVKKCVMSSVSVTTPATQSATLGKAVSLKVSTAVNGGSSSLTFTASGLPAGLSLNKTTGVISGTPGVTAGTFTPHVTVAYSNGSQTVSFTWKVSSLAGPVHGYAAKCVDDNGAKTTVGNKIQIWVCNGGTAQKITFAANSELLVVGGCITGGTTTVLGKCAGATSQEWTRQSNGEYVLKSNGECLTEPSTTNGTKLTLAACKNIATQHWSLP
jgi:hypothetical protein